MEDGTERRAKRNLEKSFEDLLQGLEDESEPDLDDLVMFVGANETNSELDIEVTSFQASNLEDSIKTDDIDDTDEPGEESLNNDEDEEEVVMRRNEDEEEVVMRRNEDEEEVLMRSKDDEVADDSDASQKEEVCMDEDASINNSADPVLEDKTDSGQNVRLTFSSEDGETVDFTPIEDTSQLDSDLSKQKIVLRKKGSLAKRRKPSRQSVRSAVLSGEESHFQDSTEPRPSSLVVNGYADDEVFDSRDESTSPPHKKPSPTTRVPLPGMVQPLSSPKARKSTEDMSTSPANPDKTKEESHIFGTPLKRVSKEQKEIENKTLGKTLEFETPTLRSVPKDSIETSKSSVQDDKSFEKPPLKSVVKPEAEKKLPEPENTLEIPTLRKTSVTLDEDKSSASRTSSGVFDVPALRSTPKPKQRQSLITDSGTTGTFDVPSLRNVEKTPAKREEVTSDVLVVDPQSPKFPIPALRNVAKTPAKQERESSPDVTDSASKTFEIPALRSVPKSSSSSSISGASDLSSGDNKDLDKGDKPAWFSEMKLRKTKSPPEDVSEKMLQEKEPEKPSWMKTAMEKKTKALEILKATENQGKDGSGDEKSSPWADQARLRRTPKSVSLEESSDEENKVTYRHSMPPNGQERLLSPGSDKELPSISPERDNYTPSWLKGDSRSQPSPKSTPSRFSGPPSVLSGPVTHEIPEWRKALAEKNKAKRESDIQVTPVKGDDSVDAGTPNWKLEFAQKRKRTSVTPKASTESTPQEPEWKRQAEERRARIQKTGLVDAKAKK